ncbi:hypothetical protein [Stieleria varia]|nr:hypothetical protein [Stieleria varia]
MRFYIVFLLVFGSVSVGAAQRSFPIETAILQAEFDRSGDHLFVLLTDRIQQIRTRDAVVLREFMIPGADQIPQETISWQTFGLTADESELVLIRPDSRFLILDLEARPDDPDEPDDPDDQWEVIEVPPDPENRSFSNSAFDMSFYGNLADGRLVFTRGSHSVRKCTKLLLYDRELQTFVGPPVDLGGNAALALRPNDESVYAIRSSLIGKPARRFWQPEPHKTQRLKIHWNDRGYGSVTVEAEGYLPDAPVSISPDLKEYTSETGRLHAPNSGWLISTLGSLQWNSSVIGEAIVPPKPIHRIFFKVLHGGNLMARWSGDSELLFIGGADYSPNPSLTGVSVFTRSGHPIAVLPTGRARFVHVLAVSHDGSRVVTSAGRKVSESTLLWHLD